MRLNRISWAFWTAGTIVIVLSWMNMVTPRVGWIGFGVALSARSCPSSRSAAAAAGRSGLRARRLRSCRTWTA
jgi:hypothetical protein